jgi:hypothetical protein
MAQYDLDLREYWRIVKRRKLIVLFTTIAMGFFSFVFAVIGSPTPLYKASAAVKFERFSPASNLLLFAYSPGDNMQTQMAIIKSYPIIQATAQELGLIPQDLTAEEIRNNTEYLGIINRLKGMVETEQEAQSSIINVHVTADDESQESTYSRGRRGLWRVHGARRFEGRPDDLDVFDLLCLLDERFLVTLLEQRIDVRIDLYVSFQPCQFEALFGKALDLALRLVDLALQKLDVFPE